jgi:hypothetical protein
MGSEAASSFLEQAAQRRQSTKTADQCFMVVFPIGMPEYPGLMHANPEMRQL